MSESKDLVPSSNQFDAKQIVVQYQGIPAAHTADPQVRERIEALAQTIDIYDFNSIIAFGQKPAEDLAESAREIIKRAEAAGTLSRGFASFSERAKNVDLEELTDLALRYANKGGQLIWANKGKAALAAVLLPVAGLPIAGSVVAATIGIEKLQKMRKGGKAVTAEELQGAINGSLLQMDEVMAELNSAANAAPQLSSDIKTFRAARLQNVNEVGIHIAAGTVRLIQARDVEYPVLKKEVEDAKKSGGDVMLEAKLAELTLGMLNLNMRLGRLYGNFGSGLNATSRLQELESVVNMVQAKIAEHRTTSKAEWDSLVADAAITSQGYDLTKAVEDADKFADKLFDQTERLHDITRESIHNSIKRGTLDTGKIVAALEKRAQSVRDSGKMYQELGKSITDSQTSILKSVEGLRKAHEEIGQSIHVGLPKLTAKIQSSGSEPKALPFNGIATETPVTSSSAEPVMAETPVMPRPKV